MNNNKIMIRPLRHDDISMIVTCFAAHNWPKPTSTFTRYFEEQQIGNRHIWLAFDDTQFAGYVVFP